MPNNRVWTGLDLIVQIYLQDEEGNVLNPETQDPELDADPVIDYCFLQSSALGFSRNIKRKKRTGHNSERLIPQDYSYTLSSEVFYFSEPKHLSVSTIFTADPALPLQLRYSFVDIATGQKDSETRVLSLCYAEKFSISSSAGGIVTASGSFVGSESLT